MTGSPLQAVVAALELAASERPQLLDFELDTFLNSPIQFAVRELASVFGVPLEQVGRTVYKACLDLDKLGRRRGAWKDPGETLESPNVAALLHLCQARVGRVRRDGSPAQIRGHREETPRGS